MILTMTVIVTPPCFGGQHRSRGDEPKFVFSSDDRGTVDRVVAYVRVEQRKIERFFGKPFPRRFEVDLCPDRVSYDGYVKKYAAIEQSEKWMVGMGIAERLVLLSPHAWHSQAVEHDEADNGHVQRLIGHELVHVYHGQSCPKPDFAGMDEMAWFVEGLAVLVSGQVTAEHETDAIDAITAGKAPVHLDEAWTGRYKYGICGSICRFVDDTWGRATTVKLLNVTSNRDALHLLGISESDLLSRWRAWASKRSGDRKSQSRRR
jgi:hypothetical protein